MRLPDTYINPAETGLYYLESRYYNPKIGRFLNADGYVATGQAINGSKMFVYCGNNPINRIDQSGYLWSEVWSVVKSVASEISRAITTFAPAYTTVGAATVLDGPLPAGDVIALIGATVITVAAVGYGTYQAISSSIDQTKEREKEIAIAEKNRRQAYFNEDPYDFNPAGLVRTEYPGTKNGRIIEWRDPVSKAKIFEWNEDYKNGAHYHAMLIEWDGRHDGMHYLPGTPVPEPWNTMYFGG